VKVTELNLRCAISGNPCGTDTYEINHPCQCDPCRSADAIRELEAKCEAYDAAKLEAESLATSLWKRFYYEISPNFELCDSVAGVISQIDNMAAGLGERITELEARVAELGKELAKHKPFVPPGRAW
jgi:hypothetical protein